MDKEEQHWIIRSSTSYNESFGVFSSLRQSGVLCDVIIVVENSKIPAHRLVLASYSPYFYSMFTSNMIEATQQEITIGNIDATAAEKLIEFAYGGQIYLHKNNVQSLFTASDLLQIDLVKEACRNFIIKQMDASNCLGIRAFADTYSSEELVLSANQFINRSFAEVSHSDEYLSLSVKQVQELLLRDQLNVASEELIFEALIAWTRYRLAERKQYFSYLLKFVRLPLLSPQYLAEKVANVDLIRKNIECRDLVDEAKDAYLIPSKRLSIESYKIKPRCFTEELGYMYAVGGLAANGNSVNAVEYYDNVRDEWFPAPSLQSMRSRLGVTALCNCIYAIGGVDGTERLSTVERLDISHQQASWEYQTSMRVHRSALGAVNIQGSIYAVGGYDGTASLNSVERYEFGKDTWNYVAPMTTCRSAAGVASLGGRIYALGGHDGLSIFNTVEFFDLREAYWRHMVPMATKRCRHGVATLENKIYVCGGYDGRSFLNTVECFDPIADKWTFVAPMSIRRSRVAMVALGGVLFVVGGYNGFCNLRSVECYDPKTNKWSYVSDMSQHEGGVGIVATPRFH
ncbi:Kelch-like protein 18 [Trichoplax sp. H2]|nr:Kelch-like protein 18 [Trichoplax sp. H2]|eukprot:RDD39942.1 Kelch-like protein 18 [Trichoplax sp. H2]